MDGPGRASAEDDHAKAETLALGRERGEAMRGRLTTVWRVRASSVNVETPCRNGSPTSWLCGLGSATGQSAMEFALALPVFFLLIFTVMDFGRMFFVQEDIEQAVLGGSAIRFHRHSSGGHESRHRPTL